RYSYIQDDHEDSEQANKKSSKDICVNSLTDTSLVQRFATDWAGQRARITSIKLRLGVPWYAYDTLTLTGEVAEIADDGLVTLTIVGTDSLGAHITSTATLYMNGDPQ